MQNMTPEERPPSPRFLQTNITKVFTNVIRTMSDQRNAIKWNRDIAKTSPREVRSRAGSSSNEIEITRLASGLNAQSPLYKTNMVNKVTKKRTDVSEEKTFDPNDEMSISVISMNKSHVPLK